MNIIACVLKSGVFKPWVQKDYTVQYGPQHVLWLRDQLAAQLKIPHRFICLTDMDVPGVETRPLQDELPGWWSKMELFREFDSAAYVDLSAVILNDVSPHLFSGRKFLMSAHLTKRHGVNSGVMSWAQSQRWLYDTFIANKDKYMAEFVVHGRWGDQDFIREHYTAKRGPIDKFQHYWPELILSYKHDILNRDTPLRFGSRKRVRLRNDWLTQPRIVKMHGSPKPWGLKEPWIPKLDA